MKFHTKDMRPVVEGDVSPDGYHYFDGANWEPVEGLEFDGGPKVYSDAILSVNGFRPERGDIVRVGSETNGYWDYWWDGEEWLRIDYGGHRTAAHTFPDLTRRIAMNTDTIKLALILGGHFLKGLTPANWDKVLDFTVGIVGEMIENAIEGQSILDPDFRAPYERRILQFKISIGSVDMV